MTRDEILNMQAGREMNDLVAMNVMDWGLMIVTDPTTRETFENYVEKTTGKGMYRPSEWSPSTDIAAAWEVVEYLQKHFPAIDIYYVSPALDLPGWYVALSATQWFVKAETAPLAICRAALLAVEEE